MSEGAMQDRYLDVLLEMVFEEQEEKAVERLAYSPDPELTEEQRGRADRALEKALLEMEHKAGSIVQESAKSKAVREGTAAHDRRDSVTFLHRFCRQRGISGNASADVRPRE